MIGLDIKMFFGVNTISNLEPKKLLSLTYMDNVQNMGLFWANIWNNLIPLLIMGIITALATIIYRAKKTIFRYFKRQKLNLMPVKFNVALSLNFNEGLNSGTYYQEIKRSLLKLIDENNLSKVVILRDFSDIKKFDSIEQAEEFRNKKQVDLIIWGGFSADGLKKDGEEIHKVDLKFTYGYIKIEGDKENMIGKMLLADINSKFAIKNYWQILDKNSSDDIEIITNNLFDLATYILGTTLKLSGRINISLNLFEKLFDKLKLGNDKFQEQVVPHLLNCYELYIFDSAFNKKNSNLGEQFCEKHLKIKPDNFFALANLALFQYRLGKEKDTETNVEKLLKLYPSLPITEVNVAFIRILQKNYQNAFKHYQKIASFRQIDFNAQEVVEFLFSQYEIKKDPALLYGAGMLSFYFGDQILARKTFREYLSKTSERDCKDMYRNAKRLSNS